MKDKRFSEYQVVNKAGMTHPVESLSEFEAKQQLCDSIDYIEKIDALRYELARLIDGWRRGDEVEEVA